MQTTVIRSVGRTRLTCSVQTSAHTRVIHSSLYLHCIQGRTEVRRRPGQETSLAPPCSNLRSFGSKCAVLEKVFATLLGLFGAWGIAPPSSRPWLHHTDCLFYFFFSKDVVQKDRARSVISYDHMNKVLCTQFDITSHRCQWTARHLQRISPEKKQPVTVVDTLWSGPALASAGPDLKHFCGGPTPWCVEIFEEVHGVMIKIADVTKSKPVRVTPRPLQQRLQWTAPLKPNKSKNCNPH